MLKKVLLTVFLLILFMQTNSMSASEIDSKMQKIVKQFIKAYNEKETDFDIATAAVFPFQADDKLSRKKVSVAVSEMLTLHLVESKKFKVIERAQLEAILQEQSLGLSGAIASETAAKVGRLMGARLSILGNVIKVGRYYQISARLVDTETSEIVSAAVSEVPIEVFDEEAARYLVLIPEYQTIGLYIGTSYAPSFKTDDLAAETHHIYTITPDNSLKNSNPITMGLRYWIKPRLMLDLSGILFHYWEDKAIDVTVTENGESDLRTLWNDIGGYGGRITLNRCSRISSRLNGYLGIGYKFLQGSGEGEFSRKDEDGEIVCRYYLKYSSYLLRTGIEWKPQSRFGWAIFCNINSAKEIDIKADIYESPSLYERDRKEVMVIKRILYPALSFETTLAVYF